MLRGMYQEKREPTTGERFSMAIQQGMEALGRQRQQEQQAEALRQAGLDPSVLNLPPEAKAEYFKNAFAKEKGLTSLQQSQEALNRAKLQQLQQEEDLYKSLKKPKKNKEGEKIEETQEPEYSEEDLETLAAFAGQPGKKGIIGQEAKNKLEKQKESRKQEQHEKEFFHTESKKYYEDLTDKAASAENKNIALQKQIPLIEKIGWTDRLASNLLGGTAWENIFKSSTAQEFDAYVLPQLEGQRQMLGGVLSDSDIRLLMQKIVTSSKTPEANEKIADYFMKQNNYTIAKKQIADEIIRNNRGYRPANFDAEVNKVFRERYGKEIKDSYEEIKNLPEDPVKLKNIGRRMVPPGTPVNEKIIDMYLEMAKQEGLDASQIGLKASQMALEDGYEFPH